MLGILHAVNNKSKELGKKRKNTKISSSSCSANPSVYPLLNLQCFVQIPGDVISIKDFSIIQDLLSEKSFFSMFSLSFQYTASCTSRVSLQ